MTTRAQLQQEIDRHRQYAEDLRARHDKAIDSLQSLARGQGRKVEGACWDVSMRRLAGEDLAYIAKMPLRLP